MDVAQGSAKRLEALRTDIAVRLRSICAAMPQSEFDELVERIASIEYKYEQRQESSALDPNQPS
jgi:hypothetical protein